MNKGVAAAVIILGLLGLGFLVGKAAASSPIFACPYGDGLIFATLKELQDHVVAEHPGERIPTIVDWS